jgi:hypothetical protein
MSNRDFAFTALGRFLVVERYRESCPPSVTGHARGAGPDRAGGHVGKRDAPRGSRAPARPRHG